MRQFFFKFQCGGAILVSPLGQLGAVGVEVAAEVEVTQLQDRGHSSNLVAMVTAPCAPLYFHHPDVVGITYSVLERERDTQVKWVK